LSSKRTLELADRFAPAMLPFEDQGHNASIGEYTLSIEKFVVRDAAPAEPIALGK
jgi:hypothetical protein